MGLYITTGGPFDPSRPATATRTAVALSITSVQLLADNPDRRFVSIFNDTNRDLFVAFGATATITDYTVKIPRAGYFETQPDGYTGEISGIWDSTGTGSARITEVS